MTQVHGVKTTSLVATMLLAAALSLTAITTSPAQSYDPDIGSGNIVRAPGVGGHFFRINPAWRASIYHHHHRARHHRAR
jgi:hypothetical protein